jgi:hypothetical protein
MNRTRTGARVLGALLALGVVSAALAPSAAAAGTTLSQTVSINAHLERVFEWTITKSVTPATWELFRGDSGTSAYTVSVTKDGGTQHAFIDGQVCVTNGGAEATQNLTIVGELRDGVPPPNDLITTFAIDVSAHPVLAPSERFCYPYSIDIPSGFVHPGGPYKITANTTITNHAPGVTDGPSTSASTTLPATETPVNNSITINDSVQGSLGTFSATGSTSYTRTFTCDADQGTQPNTATISPASASANPSASASVTVNCHALNVTKTANTSLTRTFTWTIQKSATPTGLTLATGATGSASYGVTVNATSADSNFAAKGTITVSNPAGSPTATINSVSDVVSPAIPGSVTCGTTTFPTTLAGGATLSCTYTASLPDATSRTNTAMATLQNHGFDASGAPTNTGTTGFSGTAAVDFSTATITEVDKSITVSDPAFGTTPLGTATFGVDILPKTFPAYSQTIGPYTTCGDKTVTNTASFVGSNGGTGSAQATVTVTVQCKLTVTKSLVPTTDTGLFNLLIDGVVKAANVGNAGTTGPQQVALGSHIVSETAGTGTSLSDYASTVNCGAGAVNGTSTTVSFASGDSDKSCTITNTKKGKVTVLKTTDGVVNSTRSINFTLTGPGLPAGGVTLNTFGDTDGVLDFGFTLVPGSQYTICENPVPAGFTSFWKLDNAIVTPFNPSATDSPPQDVGVRCFTFSTSAGQTRAFVIDNSHPGGSPRTIGYWKNWNKCTGGNQAATAAKNGGAAAGVFIVEDLLPQTIGNFNITTCAQAVKVLSKQDQAGTNHANDAAYELASQLLAAKLNLAAGAQTCAGVQSAVVDAQALLVQINFTGSGTYLVTASTNRTNALNLATTLANYNVGKLC